MFTKVKKNIIFRIYGNLNVSCFMFSLSAFLYRGNILDCMHKKQSGHCSCLKNQRASGSRHLLSTCGRNSRWKVLTLWLGQKGKSWALAVVTNEALNSGCGTALYNDFHWTLAVKSALLWRKFLNLKLVEHFWLILL